MAVSPKTTAFSMWPVAGQSLFTLPRDVAEVGREHPGKVSLPAKPILIFHFYHLFFPPRVGRLAGISDACPVTSIFVSGPEKQEEQGRIPAVPRFPRQCVCEATGREAALLLPLSFQQIWQAAGVVAAQPSDSH